MSNALFFKKLIPVSLSIFLWFRLILHSLCKRGFYEVWAQLFFLDMCFRRGVEVNEVSSVFLKTAVGQIANCYGQFFSDSSLAVRFY
jgi:hypothetical protein